MNIENIREALHRQPFQSFDLRLADGRAHYVPHPDFVAVCQSRIVHLNSHDEAATFVEPPLIMAIDYLPSSPKTTNSSPPQGQIPQA
jgi:hypothetical protein